MWDTLTASLCAIVHDNLPLELLNQPFHIAPEVSPIADPSTVAAQGNGPSPAWMDTARPSSDEVGLIDRSIDLLCARQDLCCVRDKGCTGNGNGCRMSMSSVRARMKTGLARQGGMVGAIVTMKRS